MRTIRNLALCIPHFAFVFAAALSGVAKTFDVDISTGRPAASNEAYYHGETIEFRAVRGRSVVTNVEYASIYYQTNGMDSVWWHTDGLVFHPTNDVGAASYRFFLEGRDDLGRDWHANGLLRLLPSPGFTPNTIELPVSRLDFAAVEVLNPPWTDPDYSTSNAALVATIEATAPAPDLSPFLRNDKSNNEMQIFGGVLSGFGFHADTGHNDDGWNQYTAHNGRALAQSLPTYIQSNPWGFALTNDFVRKTGDTMTGALIIKNNDDILDVNQDCIYLSGKTGTNYLYFPDNIYGSGEIGYDDLHYRGGFDIFATREWADHWAHATVSNTVPVWARAATKPAYTADEVGAYSTGAVDTILRDYLPLDYFRDGQTIPMYYGDGTKLCDFGANWIGDLATGVQNNSDAIAGKQDNLPYPTNAIPYAAISGKPNLATVATSGSYNDLSNKPTIPTVPTDVSAFNNDAGYLTGYTESDPTIKSWAKANTKPTYTASEVGAATVEDVYRIVAGTNVILVVTNYNSAVHAPAMKLQHLDPESGQYVTYWDEQRRHGMTLTNAMDYTDAATAAELSRADAAYAPRAWSGTTSALGAEAPAGVTWISTPETVIAGGYEYEKVITTAGAVWVLTSNGLSTGATTNSFFRVAASDGTELFSIEKPDSYLVGVNATGITKSGNTVTIPVNVVAPSHPYIRATTNLVNAVWTKEDENGFTCPFATVSWSGSSGAYVATVTCSQPQAFLYFEFKQQGTAKIKNSAKTEMTGGIIFNGTTYMPTVSGNELKFIATQL